MIYRKRSRSLPNRAIAALQGASTPPWTPAALEGLVLWLSSSNIGGLADGDPLAQWPDLSGNGNHCTQTTANLKPIYNASGLNGKPEVAFAYRNMAGSTLRWMTVPAGVSFNRNNCSIFAVGRPQSRNLTAGSCAVVALGNGSQLNFGWGPGCVTAYNGALLTTASQIPYQPHAIGMTSDGSAFQLWLDGASESFAACGSSVVAGGRLGDSGLYHYGALNEVCVFNRGLTPTEYTLLQAYAARKYFLPSSKQLVCDGDSLTMGYGAPNNVNYPGMLWGLLGQEWRLYNAASAGQNIAQMISDGVAEIDALYDAEAYARNVLVAWCGVIDILNGQTPAQTWTAIHTYCAARQSAGWQVVLCTALPSGFMDEEDRQALNALIRANWSGCADALADIAADKRIGDEGDNLNPVYYNNDDGNATHMTPAGYRIVAGIVKNAIDAL